MRRTAAETDGRESLGTVRGRVEMRSARGVLKIRERAGLLVRFRRLCRCRNASPARGRLFRRI